MTYVHELIDNYLSAGHFRTRDKDFIGVAKHVVRSEVRARSVCLCLSVHSINEIFRLTLCMLISFEVRNGFCFSCYYRVENYLCYFRANYKFGPYLS